jgi:Transposase DDE domain
MHTLLDLRGNIPSFIHISDGKAHDVHALDLLLPEAGAIYVMDRGYIDFARLYVLHQAGAFFVRRAKSNLDAHRVYSAPTDRAVGIIADRTIALDGFSTRKDYPVHLRRIRFKDADLRRTLCRCRSDAATSVAIGHWRFRLHPSARRSTTKLRKAGSFSIAASRRLRN